MEKLRFRLIKGKVGAKSVLTKGRDEGEKNVQNETNKKCEQRSLVQGMC